MRRSHAQHQIKTDRSQEPELKSVACLCTSKSKTLSTTPSGLHHVALQPRLPRSIFKVETNRSRKTEEGCRMSGGGGGGVGCCLLNIQEICQCILGTDLLRQLLVLLLQR